MKKKATKKAELSATQHKILVRCANGKTYQEIGRQIGMSKDGVDWHIRNILRLLRAKNTTNAVFKACKLGLIK
jgi:DNA-binding CsgD family transcriptional regulator